MISADMKRSLSELGIPDFKVFDSTGSTNQDAIAWLLDDAEHLSLVVADEQTAGRGRSRKRWYTAGGSSLALSLILRNPKINMGASQEIPTSPDNLLRLTAAGTLAVCSALDKDFDLSARIKWPNDVIIDGKKIAGILVELPWTGNDLSGAVIGIGVNVSPGSVPPADLLDFPAGCLESLSRKRIHRMELLYSIIRELLLVLDKLDDTSYIKLWEGKLMYLDQQVLITSDRETDDIPLESVRLTGLSESGSLVVEDLRGRTIEIGPGNYHLRPINDPE